MLNKLAPYLQYLPEYTPYLRFDGCNAECGDLEAVLAEGDREDHHGCNICELSTSSKSCLFNSEDPLYSTFQDYLRNHPELFL